MVSCPLSEKRRNFAENSYLHKIINMAGKKAKPRKTIKKLDFENLKPSDVLCPICRTILIEPVTLSCNHAFCKLCFESTMENANLVCPMCRVRVGSWFRRAKKDGKLVDEGLWKAIQAQYPTEVQNKYRGIDNVIEADVPVIVVATPGEIRKEYEQQRQKDLDEQKVIREAEEKASAPLIKKLKEEEEQKMRIEKEKLRLDEALARKLAQDMEVPTTSKFTPKKIIVSKKVDSSSKKYGPMDKFIKLEESKPNRTLPKKIEEQRILYKGGTRRISTTPNPNINFATKEYTCHVLNAESRSKGGLNSFGILNKPSHNNPGGANTLQKKIREAQKIIEMEERKSICKSGYKSSGSGSDDVIDQECKFYFKPIDTQKKYHLPGTIPVKIPSVRKRAPNEFVRPPAGKIINLQLGTVISAFAKFSMALQQTEKSQSLPPREVIEDEATDPPIRPSNRLKRKLLDEDSPVKKKNKRQIYSRKNLQEIDKKSVSSPFYGFDESSRAANSSPFYGFDTLARQESSRARDIIKKLIANQERSVIDNNSLVSTVGFYKTIKTYSRHQNRQLKALQNTWKSSEEPLKLKILNTSKNGINRSRAIQDKLAELRSSVGKPSDSGSNKRIPETYIDINRNIPKVTSPEQGKGRVGDGNQIRSGINYNSSSVYNKKQQSNLNNLAVHMDSKLETTSDIVDAAATSETVNASKRCTRSCRQADADLRTMFAGAKLVDNKSDMLNSANYITTSNFKSPNASFSPVKSNLNGAWRTRQRNGSPRKASNNLWKKDADSANVGPVIVVRISPIGNTTSGASSTYSKSTISDDTSPKTRNALSVDRNYKILNTFSKAKGIPEAVPRNTLLDDASLHTVGKTYQSKIKKAIPADTNSKITDSFSKVKSSPTKPKNATGKSNLSPAKRKLNNNIELDAESVQVNSEIDQKQIQEQSDFEMAKKLQAEFDSIRMPPRTRRGTKRQITLDEMLLV